MKLRQHATRWSGVQIGAALAELVNQCHFAGYRIVNLPERDSSAAAYNLCMLLLFKGGLPDSPGNGDRGQLPNVDLLHGVPM